MRINFASPRGTISTWVILAALLALVFWAAPLACGSEAYKKTEMRFYSMDVGQGDASLFILPDGGTILIDSGPEESSRELIKFLKSLGVSKIDLLVATHAHSDHISGMRAIMANFKIGKIWDSGFIHGGQLQNNFYRVIQQKKIPFGRPKRGFSESFGDVRVEVLAPATLLHGTKRDTNNNCLVLRIAYGQVSFLMAADMEREQYATIRPLPRASVLKAAHHGSSNGTDRRLLRDVRPSLIILSYGKYNTYGYPHRETVKLIEQNRIRRLDTKDGTIEIVTDGKDLTYPSRREVRINAVNY